MNIIFQIDGGIGKSIAASAVCKAIRKQYPKEKLIVITAYPEVFFCNPNIDRVLSHTNLNYFYQDFIEGQEVKILAHNPYLDSAFVNEEDHLVKVWCEMCGIAYDGEMPELFLTDREWAFYSKDMRSEKPILLIQTNGGAANQQNKYSWMRDIPISTAQQVVDAFTYDYHVVHIRREDQLPLQNVTPVQMDFRALAVLIQLSSKRLFMDSFAQHAAAALGKPSVVCWIGNKPEQFGYDMHSNILANEPTIKPELRYSVYSRYNIGGNPTEFPYHSEEEVFDADRIIAALAAETSKEDATGNTEMLVRRKIVREVNRKSMVAQRLMHLLGQTELTNIKRVLDIGSWHLGQSIEFANIFGEAQIDAFEPIPESYALCMSRLKSLARQKKERIRVHNLALSNEKEEVPFYVVDQQPGQWVDKGFSSLLKFDGQTSFVQHQNQREIKVQTDKLDNWCAENSVDAVDIIWMDAQGAELMVLKGAENILKNTRVVMTEVGLKPYYEGHTLKEDIDAYLGGLGFKELESSFEYNIQGYEANTIYIKN
ncbi:MAG: FkbM family methyltransferase [Bacteroidetes bacterium]|nr:FkbM family methyltransferase [Bacteroidota bacterium]